MHEHYRQQSTASSIILEKKNENVFLQKKNSYCVEPHRVRDKAHVSRSNRIKFNTDFIKIYHFFFELQIIRIFSIRFCVEKLLHIRALIELNDLRAPVQ